MRRWSCRRQLPQVPGKAARCIAPEGDSWADGGGLPVPTSTPVGAPRGRRRTSRPARSASASQDPHTQQLGRSLLDWPICCFPSARKPVRDTETTLQQFAEFLLKTQLAQPRAAPHVVRWVRRFLARPAANEPLHQVRRFCVNLERGGGAEEWQVRQADHALKVYFVNFLQRTDWCGGPASAVADRPCRVDALAALERLQFPPDQALFVSDRDTYVDWVRRFLSCLSALQAVRQPPSTRLASATTSPTWRPGGTCPPAPRPRPCQPCSSSAGRSSG